MEDKDVNVLEEKEKKEKRGSTFGVIFIALLLVGLSVACGWFANSYFNNLNKKPVNVSNTENIEEKSEEEQWKSLGIDISKVKDTYDTLKDYMYQRNLPNGGLSLEKKEIMDIIAQRFNHSDLINVEEDEYSGHGYLNYNKVESLLNKYFGNHYEIETTPTCYGSWCFLGDYLCTTISEYDSTTKLFKLNWGPCDGHGPSGPGGTFNYYFDPLRKIVDVQEKSNEIKVIEKVVYVSYNSSKEGNVYSVYSNVQKTSLIGEIEVNSEDLSNNKKYVDQFLDKAGTITSYYHKAEGGSYYFVSSEIS